jgi:hypothetical protein
MGVRRKQRVGAWGLFLDSLNGVLGVGLGIAAFFFAFVVWKWLPSTAVPLWLVALVAQIGILVIAALVVALRDATRLISFGSTKTVTVKLPHAPHLNCHCICVLAPVEPWRTGTTISFHWDDNGYERALGHGQVVSEQDNGFVGVALTYVYEGAEVSDFLRKLKDGNNDAIEKLGAKAVLIGPLAETKSEQLVGTDTGVAAIRGAADRPVLPPAVGPDPKKGS